MEDEVPSAGVTLRVRSRVAAVPAPVPACEPKLPSPRDKTVVSSSSEEEEVVVPPKVRAIVEEFETLQRERVHTYRAFEEYVCVCAGIVSCRCHAVLLAGRFQNCWTVGTFAVTVTLFAP
jgi:hypothetical protein